jgi:hypothetical protein
MFLTLTASACGQIKKTSQGPAITTEPEIVSIAVSTSTSPRPTNHIVATQTSTLTQLATVVGASQTPLPEADPAGCRPPISEYGRLSVNGWTINQRTFNMLEHAALLYDGKIDITGSAITQGSYNDNGPASFGTHLGGGAVDISVIQLPEYVVLYNEIEPLIAALRTAGFAAWLREVDEAYPGTGIHIHAIAVGDKELSYPAQQQLTGKSGYLRGFDGLPTSGVPGLDRHGGPILCSWMLDEGYSDLRPMTPTPNTHQ